MTAAMQLAGVVAALVVLVVCVLRVDLLRAGEHRVSVFGAYLLWAVFAFGVLLELLRGADLDWYEAAGLAGLLMHLSASRKHWRECAPRDAQVRGQHG